jgi:UDP-glucose 4-epimerase
VRILITGGFGFIGGRLAKFLDLQGHEIVIASRSESSAPQWLPRTQVFKVDWSDGESLELACSNVDAVIHCAGMNSIECERDPISALNFGRDSTAELIRIAASAGVSQFIYLSTAHVYVSPLVGEISESHTTENSHPYAQYHLAGEGALNQAIKSGAINGTSLRLSNSYGAPVQKDVDCWSLLVNDLCKQASQNKEIVLRSAGTQERDFITMSDLCRVISHLLLDFPTGNYPNVMNIGSGTSMSVLAMAKIVQDRCSEVLGFLPDIRKVSGIEAKESPSLKYNSNFANLYADQIQNDMYSEIDDLLSFCAESFRRI